MPRRKSLTGVLGRDPRVDALPPVVEPAELDLVVGPARNLAGRHPPPAGAHVYVGSQAVPDVAGADQPVQAGVCHEDHVRGRAGVDRRERPATARQKHAGHRGGPFGQVIAVLLTQPGDGAAPAQRRPVAALGEQQQGAAAVEARGQPPDLLGVRPRSGPPAAHERVGQPVGHHVQAGVELQRRLHDHARAPIAGAEQVVDEQ